MTPPPGCNTREALRQAILPVKHAAGLRICQGWDDSGIHFVMVRKRLFNCEVIALLTASYLIAIGLQILAQVFLPTQAERVPAAWEYYGFLLLALGLISGSIFWLIRRFLNKK
ncbi:MAG: hypothetical protein ABSF34_00645 [Verrucomicrobiota bacterium]